MSYHKNPLPSHAILDYDPAHGYFITRKPGHVGRKYETARQAESLIITREKNNQPIQLTKRAKKSLLEKKAKELVIS